MRKLLGFLVAAMLLAACGSPFLNTPAIGPAEAAGLMVVGISENTTEAELESNPNVNYGYVIVKVANDFNMALFDRLGATKVGELSFDGNRYVRLQKDGGIVDLVQRLQRSKGVQWAEVEIIHSLITPPRDYSRALVDGNLTNDPRAEASEYALNITQALDAYREVGYGTNTVYVGVIDTGINATHEDFQIEGGGNVIAISRSPWQKTGETWSWVGSFVDQPLTENWDHDGHGTHVAGTIAALGDNDKGVAGVAYENTKIIFYQGFGAIATGSTGSVVSPIYDGLVHMTDEIIALRIAGTITQETVPVNMSLGGPIASSFTLECINYALRNNVLPVVSMGNDGRRLASYPAAYQGVLANGATNGKDEKVHFSQTGQWINVSAPGFDIISLSNEGDDLYAWMSGTSMSSPFIAGMLGYLLSFDNGQTLTPAQLISLAEQTADQLQGADGTFNENFGWGRVNVLNAASYLTDGAFNPATLDNYVPTVLNVAVTNISATYDSGIAGFTSRMPNQAVYLYDSTGVFVAAGHTNSVDGTAQFWNLKPGVYQARTNYKGSLGTADVTMTAGIDELVTVVYDVDVYPTVYICTVPNMAYADGATGADTMITLYDSTQTQLEFYDSSYLDTMEVELEPGTYYIMISSYNDSYPGEYGMYVGFDKKTSVNVLDGARATDTEDSAEPNDAFVDAFELTWQTEYGFTHHVGTDTDYYTIVVPVAP